MKRIELRPYGRPHPADKNDVYFVDTEHGKEVAEKTGLLAAVQAGEVNIVLDTPTANRISESFIKGFILPAAREVGIDEFVKRVKLNGKCIELELRWGWGLECDVARCLGQEKKRQVKAAKEKARKTTPNVWSPAFRFFVPEIGTVVRLAKDWTFRLHYEYRNEKLLELFGRSFSWRGLDYNDHGKKVGDVTLKAGAELSVNRVYIRQGAGDFSSITFYLSPKSVIVIGKSEIVSKGKVRFWAKLSDVNKMEVQVDTNTLATN